MTTPSRDALLARYAQIGTSHAPAPTLPAPTITPVHRQVVALLDELLESIAPNAGPYAGMLRTFKHLEPMLLRDFAKTSPEQVVAFAHYLGGRMMEVGAAASGADQEPATQPGQDQSQSA